ncbi:MAG: kelch repeat-containing protein [Anaerolineae bacterium]
MTTPNSHDSSETSPVSKQRGQVPIYRRRGVHVLLLTALFISLLAFLALASTEADEGDVIVASASSAQNSYSATLLTDGRVLVAGGWSGTTAIATADLFDPDARTWGATAPLLTPRMTGMNWVVPGLGSGSDYAAAGGGASAVLGDGGSWVEIRRHGDGAEPGWTTPLQNYGLAPAPGVPPRAT